MWTDVDGLAIGTGHTRQQRIDEIGILKQRAEWRRHPAETNRLIHDHVAARKSCLALRGHVCRVRNRPAWRGRCRRRRPMRARRTKPAQAQACWAPTRPLPTHPPWVHPGSPACSAQWLGQGEHPHPPPSKKSTHTHTTKGKQIDRARQTPKSGANRHPSIRSLHVPSH